ncbi:vWA domain-containing protein [Neorhodopirellula pilleata]|uniref:von Willebrand factor n=1 Tax=Neorhodopirellula pilleata TaxID=2714738 RepID=A0A5C6APZ4_9BACT|nr:von Willebrand factor type A domain-containing protein [Neorhodopirellula pilleata]TWU01597.1 von Willebrand factor [Neorhodopirellula pilleata]
MNTPAHDTTTEIDLETRIVACVLGEASDFERDQIARLIEERPELAAVKRRFENMHDLLSDIGQGDLPGEHSEWKLPSEKRDALLAVFDGQPLLVQPRRPSDESADRSSRRGKYGLIGTIATVACVACLAGLLLLPQVRSVREVVSARAPGKNDDGGIFLEGGVTFFDSDRQNGAEVAEFASDSMDYSISTVEESLRSIEESLGSKAARVDSLSDGSGKPQRFEGFIGESVTPSRSFQIERPNINRYAESRSRLLETRDGLQVAPALKEQSKRVAEGLELPQVVNGLSDDDQAQSTDLYFGYDFGTGSGMGEMSGMAGGLGGGLGGGNLSVPGSGQPPAQDKWFERTLPGMASAGNDPIWVDLGKNPSSISPSDPTSSPAAPPPPVPATPAEESADNLFDYSAIPSATAKPADRPARKQSEKKDALPEVIMEKEQESFERERLSLSDQNLPASKDKKLVASAEAQTELHLVETDASQEPFSTFSLHVSDVSFQLAAAALSANQWPDSSTVRIEEFVNAFDYGDPLPGANEAVACRIEQAIHPFAQQRNLLRVSMRTAAAGRASTTPLRLTLLLDNSGSMERIDRQQTVRRAFALLAEQLQPDDQITLISFARNPRLLADRVSGATAEQFTQLVENLPSEGGTNVETALQLAFEKAIEQRLDGAQNRIVLLTDGAVNLGNADPERLSEMIATFRDSGIAFDAAGISANGLNDEILEALTRKGDGRYYLLDSVESADSGFAKQIAGALRPSAKNVKVQIEFNPNRVGRYKLLGFEKHRLNQEDFRNDAVDAAEMSAAEAGVAVYQFEPLPNGDGDVGSVSVRFRDLSTGQMVENRWPIPYQADATRLDEAPAAIQIAGTAAMFAARLRGDASAASVDFKTLAEILSGLPETNVQASRVQQLRQMIQQARQISNE